MRTSEQLSGALTISGVSYHSNKLGMPIHPKEQGLWVLVKELEFDYGARGFQIYDD